MFGSGQCLIIATRKEMGTGNAGMHSQDEWIEWAEALDVREMLDRHVGFAIYDPHPTTEEPSGHKIGIEHESPTDHGHARVEVAGDFCNDKTRDTECCRIIRAQSCRKPRQPLRFARLLAAGRPKRKRNWSSTMRPSHRLMQNRDQVGLPF